MRFENWVGKKQIDEQIDEAMGFVQKLPYQEKKSGKEKEMTRSVSEPKNIEKAVKIYVKGVQQIIDDIYKKQYSNLKSPEITFKKGGRYIKIIKTERSGSGTSVHSFIDAKEGPEFGNIYKPASWKAPAKGARGNVFSTQNGLEAIGKSGTGGIWYAR